MFDVDNAPVILFCLVLIALLVPQIYSFFVDKFIVKFSNKGEQKN